MNFFKGFILILFLLNGYQSRLFASDGLLDSLIQLDAKFTQMVEFQKLSKEKRGFYSHYQKLQKEYEILLAETFQSLNSKEQMRKLLSAQSEFANKDSFREINQKINFALQQPEEPKSIPLNACSMEGAVHFPGWGDKKDGYIYECREEVSRETISEFWKNEQETFKTVDSREFTLDFGLAVKLGKVLSGLILGDKFKMSIEGKLRFVVKVKFRHEFTLKASSKAKYEKLRVWVKLYEAKKPWPWQDPDFKYVGNTYSEIDEPAGSKVVMDAVPVNLKEDLHLYAIEPGEIVEIGGVKYQMGYELLANDTEVLGYRHGINKAIYKACHQHTIDLMQDKIEDAKAVVGSLDVGQDELHLFYEDRHILYRHVKFNKNFNVSTKREWFNQRIRSWYQIYRKKVSGWFNRWEKVNGKKSKESEWNIGTLAYQVSKGPSKSCQ